MSGNSPRQNWDVRYVRHRGKNVKVFFMNMEFHSVCLSVKNNMIDLFDFLVSSH